MTRLKQVREAFGYSLERLAEELNLPAQTIRAWETEGHAPSLLELRDLAMVYGAGADDLTGDDPIVKRPIRSIYMVHEEGVDGFWGHIGMLLPGSVSYRWYPISSAAADMAAQELERRDQAEGEPRALVVETLNNRFLWINLTMTNGVCLCADAAEWPQPYRAGLSGPGLDQIDLVRPDHLLPAVLYEIATEMVEDAEECGSPASEQIIARARSLLEERASIDTDEQVKRLLLHARLWMSDERCQWIDASSESMADVVSELQLDGGDGLLRLEGPDHGYLSYAVSLERVAAMEFPAARL